jgi:hypothetical protein
MINDERWKSLGETEPNPDYVEILPLRDGLEWCGKDYSSFVDYACQFCNGTGWIDDCITICDVCHGSGHYEDICCDYHAEQLTEYQESIGG